MGHGKGISSTDSHKPKELVSVSGEGEEVSRVREQREIIAMELYSSTYQETVTASRNSVSSKRQLDMVAAERASKAVDYFYAKFP